MGSVGQVQRQYAADPFIGRGDERAALEAALEANPVVVVRGPGGVGKTRLAVEVAAAWAHPAVVAELSAVDDPDHVAGAIATALGLVPSGAVADAVADRLAIAPVLVLVDNAEHVLGAVEALLGELGGLHPDTRILVTSRRTLDAPAVEFDLEPLRVDGEAADLFDDRARRARANLEPDDPAIAAILAHTGGLPLAIELAAARTRYQSLEEVAAGLGSGSLTLSSPSVGSMEASIARSWDLLGDVERRVLRRMAVFAGPVGLDGVVAVGDGSIDLLSELNDASLVVGRFEPGRPTRYALLPPIRRFMADRLDDAGESKLAARRHLDWVCELLAPWLDRIDVIPDRDAMEVVGERIDEVRLAVSTAVDLGDLDALDQVTRCWTWWRRHGRLPELVDALGESRTTTTLRVRLALASDRCQVDLTLADEAVASARHAGDVRNESLIEADLAALAISVGDLTSAAEHARRALELSGEAGDGIVRRFALVQRCRVAMLSGRFTELDAAMADLALEAGPYESGFLALMQASLAILHGEFAQAAVCTDEARSWFVTSGNRYMTVVAATQALSLAERLGADTGDDREALYAETLQLGDPTSALNLASGGLLRSIQLGRMTDAAVWADRIGRLRDTAGPLGQGLADLYLADHALCTGRLDEAQQFVDRSLAESGHLHEILPSALRWSGLVAANRGDLAGAVRLLRQSLAVVGGDDFEEVHRNTRLQLGPLLVQTGEIHEARSILERSIGAEGTEPHLSVLRVAVARADGDLVSARRWLVGLLRTEFDLGHLGTVPDLLDLACDLDADEGNWERATLLGAAADAFRDERGLAGHAPARSVRAAVAAGGNAVLGRDTMAGLTARGATLSLDDAVALAEGRLEAIAPTDTTRPGRAPETAAPVAPASAGPRATLRRSGRQWLVGLGDATHPVPASRGLDYLERLIGESGREVHVLDLASDRRAVDQGDAGVVLDDKAKRAYRARLQELDEDLAEAEDWGDVERVERITAERDAFIQQLSAAVGLGGRDRRAGGAAERARIAVKKAVTVAIRKIAEYDPALAHHLQGSVRTGTYCSYVPDPARPLEWDLGGD